MPRGHRFGLGMALCWGGLLVALGPLLRYRQVAARVVERGHAASFAHAVAESLVAITVFLAIGAILVACGALLLRGAVGPAHLVGGLALVVPGLLTAVYGGLQILGALGWLWSGEWRSTGYGLVGSVVLSLGVFGVPVLVLGAMLIAAGASLLRDR